VRFRFGVFEQLREEVMVLKPPRLTGLVVVATALGLQAQPSSSSSSSSPFSLCSRFHNSK
jgi:hypothetical protein